MCYYIIVPREQRKVKCVCRQDRRQKGRFIMTTEKFCTRCGKKFLATGREVICPSCKQAAAEESKRAAVLRAKRASWAGESVPVRISGRASTLIREYGAANGVPFAESLDALLKASDFFQSLGKAWEEVEPYKSHRRDKHATENTQEAPQAADKPQDAPQEVKAAKVASKTTSKAAGNKAASKASKATSKK